MSEMLGAQRKMAINIEHRRIWTMMDPEYLDPRETSAIKVEKIDFPKTKLARLASKLFLHPINSAKALRRQKANNGSGCRKS